MNDMPPAPHPPPLRKQARKVAGIRASTSGWILASILLITLSACSEDQNREHQQESPATPQQQQLPVSRTTEPVTGMELILVEGGCFQMGCGDWTTECGDEADEKPSHEVCLESFYLGSHEVTQGQWVKIIQENPSYFKKGDNYPVDRVSWDAARNFTRKLNEATGSDTYRLPTEAEWEYAARSRGKADKFAGGNSLDKIGWYDGNSNNSTHPVGVKYPNALGLYDMSGNLWEWVEDIYAATYYQHSPRANPRGPAAGDFRVKRGGSYKNDAQFCRTTTRYRTLAGITGKLNGFRVARSAH